MAAGDDSRGEMMETNSCIAVYRNRDRLNSSVLALVRNYDGKRKISVIGEATKEDGNLLSGIYSVEKRVQVLEAEVPFWKFLAEHLEGGMAWIVRPHSYVMVGALVPILEMVMKEEGGSDKSDTIGKILSLIGVTYGSVLRYKNAIDSGECLVVVHGSQSDVERAYHLLRETKPQDIAIHLA